MKKKRLLFCTYSSIYSSLVLDSLLKSDHIEVTGIVNSTRLLKPSYGIFRGALSFIYLTGWRYASYLFMVTDLFRLLHPLSHHKSVHALARQHHIPLLDTRNINTEGGLEFVRQHRPDILLAAHFNQLLKPTVLQIPTIAALNIHPSLLPAYRGVDPVLYALLQHEKQLGVSVHLMDDCFDTGPVICQQALNISVEDSVFTANLKLFAHGASIALQIIENGLPLSLDALSPAPCSQKQKITHYDSWPSRNQLKQLSCQGYRLLRLRHYLSALKSD